jgi:hypothetical protein
LFFFDSSHFCLCEGGWISRDLVGKEKKSMVPAKMFEFSFLHTSGKEEGWMGGLTPGLGLVSG